MSKVIGRFDPTPSRTPAECERHYTQVHIPMAQNLLRGADGFESYHVNRAVAQADVAGGFHQQPRAWRFNMLRSSGDLAFTADQLEMITRDHVNCLYRLRHCEVRETVALDRRHGEHTVMAKFLLEAERDPGATPAEAEAAFARLADAVAETMEGAFGARLLLRDEILNEALTEPYDVEGQRVVGATEDTTRAGYLECYFDHARWGREALAPLARTELLRDPALAYVNLLEVDEQAPLDLRRAS